MPWDIREARNEKRMSKSTPAKKSSKAPLPPMSLPMCKLPCRRLAVSGCLTPQHRAKDSRPVQVRTPTAGTKLLTMSRFTKLIDQKCAVLVGFYNSKDAEMSREFL